MSVASTTRGKQRGSRAVSFRGDCMRTLATRTDTSGLGGTMHDADVIEEDEHELVVDQPPRDMHAEPHKGGLGANRARAGPSGPFGTSNSSGMHGSRQGSARSTRSARELSGHGTGSRTPLRRDSSASSSSSHLSLIHI